MTDLAADSELDSAAISDFVQRAREVETELRKDSSFYDFTKPAEALLGDSIATNVMMLGYAYQRGLLPLSAAAIKFPSQTTETALPGVST